MKKAVQWDDLRLGADLVYLLLGGEPVSAAGESFSTIGKGSQIRE